MDIVSFWLGDGREHLTIIDRFAFGLQWLASISSRNGHIVVSHWCCYVYWCLYCLVKLLPFFSTFHTGCSETQGFSSYFLSYFPILFHFPHRLQRNSGIQQLFPLLFSHPALFSLDERKSLWWPCHRFGTLNGNVTTQLAC